MTCAAGFTDAETLAAMDGRELRNFHLESEETSNGRCRSITEEKLNGYENYFHEE